MEATIADFEKSADIRLNDCHAITSLIGIHSSGLVLRLNYDGGFTGRTSS